ncbi:glycosyltransferase family 39 protein [uncultured Cellulomonas sp.]|uniref:glycosyltransferase family 39 protein n=1 Tax=uncultured Cellulomonas sp. TaxID=189682 RepID=UPI0026215518|nr:glycosyltransferase family 39 protein [uncultured Cellulomonas sp.]
MTAPVVAPPVDGRTSAASAGAAAPLAVGAGAALLGALGSWVPSVWADEAATISATTRPWGALGRLVENIDAVHAVYYAVVHVWFGVVGTSVLTLRLLSAIAVGVAAAGVVVLGRTLAGPAVGMAAGVVFAVLPRVTWMATEGRSSALAAAAAVWLTVLLVAAVRRGGAGWWVAYAVAAGLAVDLWMFLGFLVAAHGAAVLWARVGARRVLAFAAAAAVAVGLAAPVVLRAAGQAGQVSWIPPVGLRTLRSVAVDQWFGTDGVLSLPLALVCWAAVLVAVVRGARRPQERPGPLGQRSLLVVALPWLVLPTAGVVAYSLVAAPMYAGKYLAFSVPALALLVGAAVAAVRPVSRRVLVLAVVALLAVPSYLSERVVTAKDASDWRLVAEHVDRVSRPGDAVVFTDVLDAEGASRFPGRIVAAAYPDVFAPLDDPTRAGSAWRDGTLWDRTVPLDAAADGLRAADRVLLVADLARSGDGPELRTLQGLGLRVVDVWEGTQTAVLVLEPGRA